MTREEARKILYDQWQSFLENNIDYAGISEAYKMAIKALEYEPCEDAISRQAVLDMMNYGILEDNIETMPSVKPQPKTGHWIRFKEFENGYYHIKCSKCGQYWSVDGHAKTFKYCFNCGAKMEEVKE